MRRRRSATINEALHRLNSVLFGPQEYAIVATTVAINARESFEQSRLRLTLP